GGFNAGTTAAGEMSGSAANQSRSRLGVVVESPLPENSCAAKPAPFLALLHGPVEHLVWRGTGVV
ncbi:MAG: hypothetical protein OXU67_12545, partial [Chloroflexota bacterium]|nr:hypothetical protein [Chloroflexota bacterium]